MKTIAYISYKVGCGVRGCTHIEALKVWLAWATEEWLQSISNIVLFKTIIPWWNRVFDKPLWCTTGPMRTLIDPPRKPVAPLSHNMI